MPFSETHARRHLYRSESHCLLLGHKSLPLGRDTLLPPLAGSLGLGTLGVHLLLEDPLTLLLGLGLVDLQKV